MPAGNPLGFGNAVEGWALRLALALSIVAFGGLVSGAAAAGPGPYSMRAEALLSAGWQLNEGSRGVSESRGTLVVGLRKPLPTGETTLLSVIGYTHESSYLPSNVRPPALRISLKSPEID